MMFGWMIDNFIFFVIELGLMFFMVMDFVVFFEINVMGGFNLCFSWVFGDGML